MNNATKAFATHMPPATAYTSATSATAATAAGCCLADCSKCCRSFYMLLSLLFARLPCYKIAASLTHVDTSSLLLASSLPVSPSPTNPHRDFPLHIQLASYPSTHIIHSQATWWDCQGIGGKMSDGSEYRAYRHQCHCVSVTSSHPNWLPQSPGFLQKYGAYATYAVCRMPNGVLRAVIRVIAGPKAMRCEQLSTRCLCISDLW